MAPYATLIPELEQAIQHGSAGKRADMAERVTALFIGGADRLSAEQIGLFDQVLGRLIDEIDHGMLADIARRIAPLAHAPIGMVRRLAGDEDIDVAGPVLRVSPRLPDDDLAAIAGRMGPEHLLAISQRPAITMPVTNVLVRRGDSNVLRVVAANRGALFSDLGFSTLVKRAAGDDGLAEMVGLRPDLPAAHLHQLIREATKIVRRRLTAVAPPAARSEIHKALATASAEVTGRIATANRDAQRTVLTLVRAGKLDAAQLRVFADNGQLAETVAALSALSRVPIELINRQVRGDRLDALLILGRAIGIDWPTLRAVIVLRTGRSSGPSLEEARANFERLSRPSAERVVSFWRNSGTTAARPT